MVSKGTHVIIPLVDYLKDRRWEAKIVEQNGNKIKLSVNSPANAVCGLYGLTVTSGSSKSEATAIHNCNKNIVMLFNPWCEGEFGSGCDRGEGGEKMSDRRYGGEKGREKKTTALHNMSGMIYTLSHFALALRYFSCWGT